LFSPTHSYQRSTISLNNQNGFYSFYSTAYILRTVTLAKVNVTVNFHNGKIVDSNNLSTLAALYLSWEINQNTVESLYQRGGNPIINSLPIATAMLNDLFYTQVVEWTIQNLESNYIHATIGSIQDLENEQKRVMCLYTPYAHFNVTVAVLMITG
jgi:hypothetical protein